METQVNYLSIVVATVVQFVLGAFWYSPLMFGKMWMSIMEVSHYTKEELQKMQKTMMPYYLLQIVITFVTTWVLAHFIGANQSLVSYLITFWVWIGFVFPTSVSSIVWGSTKRKYWLKQIAISGGMQLIGLMLATYILTF